VKIVYVICSPLLSELVAKEEHNDQLSGRQLLYLSRDRLVESGLKLDAAARHEMWQIEVEMNAKQQKTDWVWISYVDSLQTPRDSTLTMMTIKLATLVCAKN